MWKYIELTKPRITWLIVLSAAIGYMFGATEFRLLVLLHTFVGTGLMASGTAALNQWSERRIDRQVLLTSVIYLPAIYAFMLLDKVFQGACHCC